MRARMALTSGTKLGPYEIQSPLGAGGMGEVYRALDTRLGRDVAIKVLSPHLSSDPELKTRFEREARAISALQHPHICTLYDVGHQDGVDYLVMEFLEGETLQRRLLRGALPLKEALEYGIEIAEALDRAHRAGIVHRDLKPGNIMLTKSGAKLLDFGLAKPVATMAMAGGVGSLTPSTPTMSVAALTAQSAPLTQRGTVVGTFQYIAPEVLQGRDADARSDVFALGAVLYEMLTGRRAFEGKSQLSVMTAILEKEPEPIAAIQPLTPPVLEHTIRRAIEKDPDRRWQSCTDVAGELRWISEADLSRASVVAVIGRRPWRPWAASFAVAAIALGAGIAIGIFSHPQPQQASIHTVILPPEKTTLALIGDFAGPPVISPDGAYVAFTASDPDGHSNLWLRPMNASDAHPLAGTQGAIFPFWSPDSRTLGFFADGKLKTTDLNGRAPVAVADAPAPRGGSWSSAGDILFEPDANAALLRVSASGGPVEAVTHLDSAVHTSHRWPFFLPDGKHFLYLAISHDPTKASNDAVFYASLDGRENRKLLPSLSNAIYANGYLLFARDTQLLAQAFDPATGKLGRTPQRVADGVANDPNTWHMDASASWSADLLLLGSGGNANLDLIWVDRDGKQLGVVAEKITNLQAARVSPQGDRVALQIDTGVNDIWVLDVTRKVRTRLTFGEPGFNGDPVWAPDGKSLVYDAIAFGSLSDIYRINTDGSGPRQLLLKGEHYIVPVDWSRDGRYLLYAQYASATGSSNEEIWALPLSGGGKPFLVVKTGFTQSPRHHSLSPNGRWLAYTSTESGQPEVFVVPFGGGQGKWQISQNGGGTPFWSSDGKELFYVPNVLGAAVNALPVSESGNTLRFGPPHTLFNESNVQHSVFDVAPGGKKFLDARVIQQTSQPITVISNWSAELKK